MDPVIALRQIAYYKDRAREEPRRVMAYRNAADIVEGLTEAERERHGAANSWQSLPGIGPRRGPVASPTRSSNCARLPRISAAAISVRRSKVTFTCTQTGRTARLRSRR